MTTEQTLIALERAGWAALAEGRGVQFYEEVFLDDGLMLLPVGAFNKTDSLEGLSSAPPWASYDLRNLRTLQLSSDVASVIYEIEAQRTGQPVYKAALSSTYVQRHGAWKLALHTQTPLTT